MNVSVIGKKTHLKKAHRKKSHRKKAHEKKAHSERSALGKIRTRKKKKRTCTGKYNTKKYLYRC